MSSDLPEADKAASGVPRSYAVVKDFCPHCNEFMQFDNESRSYGIVQRCRRCRRVMDTTAATRSAREAAMDEPTDTRAVDEAAEWAAEKPLLGAVLVQPLSSPDGGTGGQG